MPHLRPSVPAHATHDELLVARLAGRDALDPGEHASASALVAGCAECALLASDIAAISRAVATEVVPARRRDFRISPEQAAELRGSLVRRFLRRFSLPSGGGALKPLASGALSIGLVLVFVGSVIPRQPVEPATAPSAVQLEEDRLRTSDDFAAASPTVKLGGGREEFDTMGGDPPANDGDPGVDTAGEDPSTMALEMGAAADPLMTSEPIGATGLVDGAAAPEGAQESLDRAMAVPSADLFAARQSAPDVAPDERADVAADGLTDQTLDDGGAAIVSDGNGLDVGLVLVVTGVALVGVGVVLVLMLLLARRHPGDLRR